MKRRRISTFSQRDRVPLSALRPGDPFVWKGHRYVCGAPFGDPLPKDLHPYTRVIVSRRSGRAAQVAAQALSRWMAGDPS